MKEKIFYEANDGSLFNTKEKCKEYENNSKEKIIEKFKGLIVRQAEGIKITDSGEAFALAEISECWGYAVIVMHNEEDYEIARKYADLHNIAVPHILNEELIISIGDIVDKNKYEYNWFYCYGTVKEQIEKYKNALMNFGKTE